MRPENGGRYKSEQVHQARDYNDEILMTQRLLSSYRLFKDTKKDKKPSISLGRYKRAFIAIVTFLNPHPQEADRGSITGVGS